MADKDDPGLSELHETSRGGEHVLIRRLQPEDIALYRDFLSDVSAEDLRLRFFGRVAELSAAEIDSLAHLDYRHETAFIALDEGLRRVYGDVLPENTTMLQMCAELGFHALDRGSGITRVVLHLGGAGGGRA